MVIPTYYIYLIMQGEQFLLHTPITSIHLHLHPCIPHLYHNTLYLHALHLHYPSVHQVRHSHPLPSPHRLPYAIINQQIIVPLQKLDGLVQCLAGQSQIRMCMYRPVWGLCGQLAELGRVTTTEGNNPYWLMVSPVKKYQQYKENMEERKRMIENTQYFDHDTEEISTQHVKYKADVLVKYLTKVNRSALVLLAVHAMMKSLHMNNPALYNLLAQHEILLRYERQGYELIQKQSQQRRGEHRAAVDNVRFVSLVDESKYEARKQQKPYVINQVFADRRVEFLSRLVAPVLVFLILWRGTRTIDRALKVE